MANFEQITKSQLCHAHSILEDKQRIMTQYRYLFTDEEREANGIAILAIEKQMEHLEGDREMKEDKYSVIVDNDKVAEHMPLEVAGTLVYALCKKWAKEGVTTIIIAREPVRVEEEDDD